MILSLTTNKIQFVTTLSITSSSFNFNEKNSIIFVKNAMIVDENNNIVVFSFSISLFEFSKIIFMIVSKFFENNYTNHYVFFHASNSNIFLKKNIENVTKNVAFDKINQLNFFFFFKKRISSKNFR